MCVLLTGAAINISLSGIFSIHIPFSREYRKFHGLCVSDSLRESVSFHSAWYTTLNLFFDLKHPFYLFGQYSVFQRVDLQLLEPTLVRGRFHLQFWMLTLTDVCLYLHSAGQRQVAEEHLGHRGGHGRSRAVRLLS